MTKAENRCHRMRPSMIVTSVCALAILALGLPGISQAEGARCLKDSLGKTYCAQNPSGVAVRSGLGEIVCARGQCVQEEHNTEWRCSRKPGGWARMGYDGPECEHECYDPSERECQQM